MKFFVLRDMTGSDAETLYEPVGEKKRGDAPVCPVCGRYVGMKPWLPPYIVKLQTYGSQIGDLVFATGGDLLVSERFVNAWRHAGLRGISAVDPVEVVAVTGTARPKVIPSFFHVAPTRTEARIDESRSTILHDEQYEPTPCDFCGGKRIVNGFDGLYVDENSWRGEDIFVPWGISGVTFVTERVVSLASDHDLRNVTTIPAESYRWPLGLRRD